MADQNTQRRDALDFVQDRNAKFSTGGVVAKPDPEAERERRRKINEGRDAMWLRQQHKFDVE